MATFGSRMQELRKAKEWTQEDLASRLGITRSAVGMYEQGVRTPDFDTLDDIADLLNASFDYLLGSADNNTGYPRHGMVISIEPKYGDAAQAHRVATYADKLLQAYKDASPDTQAAVRAILHVEEA